MRSLLLLASLAASVAIPGSGVGKGQPLTVERLEASPDLDGPVARGVKIAPDSARVTFLQGRSDDLEQQDLWEYHIADGVRRLLVDSRALLAQLGGAEQLDEVELARRERQRIFASGIIEYDYSPDGKALLFPLGGDLYYLPIGGKPRRLTNTEATETDAQVSPLGRYVSFVREQNLFVLDLSTGKERALTTAGGGAVSYGMADFAAQEEMSRFTGYWWSKDDTHIAFTRVDETPVTLVNRYEIAAAGVTSVPQRYPFAGEANATVELFVIELANGSVREVALGDDKDFYLARVDYAADGTLAVQRQSRDQKRLDLIFVAPSTLAQTLVLSEVAETWINLHSDLQFVGTGSRFLWTSERSGFRHLYLYQNDGSLIRQLTTGDWPVAGTGRSGGGVKAVDEARGEVYFTGWRSTPTEQNLYRLKLDGTGPIQQLTDSGGWHSAAVARDGSFFVDSGQTPTRPPYTAIRDRDGQLLTFILENALDKAHPYFTYLSEHRPRSFGTLKAEDGTPLHYQLTLPANFDEARTYPAIVHVYGGPEGALVHKRWTINLDQVLARSGFLVFTLDNRGTGNRGVAFDAPIYRNLGDIEVQDQVAGARFLRALPYVDAQRIGVYGWSYGGTMSLLSLFKAPEIFKAGIAGAPVVDWRLYDTHYTERYLGDPAAGDAYKSASPLSYVDGLRGHLLLIHGMADDNVFFDNSIQLMSALQKAGKPFELMTYPGKRHRISGEAERVHLNRLQLDFFQRRLSGSD